MIGMKSICRSRLNHRPDGVFLPFESAEMYRAVGPNSCPPFVQLLAPSYAGHATPVVDAFLGVARIFSRRGPPQVNEPIVACVAINMINTIKRIVSICNYPCNAMKAIMFIKNGSAVIPVVPRGEGSFPRPSRIPSARYIFGGASLSAIKPRGTAKLPSQKSGFRIIVKQLPENFLRWNGLVSGLGARHWSGHQGFSGFPAAPGGII